MKKLIMLLALVPFGTNAQESIPYSMDTSNVADWNLSYTGSYNPNSPYVPKALYAFIDFGPTNILVFEKYFDFSNSSDVSLSFEFLKHFGNTQMEYRVEIDNDEFYYNLTNTDFTGSIELTSTELNQLIDPSNALIKISIEKIQSGDFIGSIGYLNINHTEINTTGMDEIESDVRVSVLDGQINIESKSILESIEVFSLDGRLIYQNEDLNQTKTSVSITKSGIYIVNVNGIISKKTFVP